MRKDIFHVQINKTASTSIRQALGIEDHPRHLTAQELSKRFPCCWDDAFTFAFVRSPYERVVSSYMYKLRHSYDCIGQLNASFDEWVKAVYLHRAGPMFTHGGRDFMPCFSWITDESGDIMVDEVYRFEDFDAEVERLKGDLAKRGIGADFTVPHLKKNPHPAPWQSFYTDPQTRRIVADFFAVDFMAFGYDLEIAV